GEKEALTQKALAYQQKQKANQSAAEAEAASQRADTNEQKAEGAAHQATTQAARAKRETSAANQAATMTTQQRRAAQVATTPAVREKKIARASQIAANARALLVDDPRKSVQRALTASAAFQSAGVNPGREVEDTLRKGLAALRIEAIFSGVGVVNVVSFTPDA